MSRPKGLRNVNVLPGTANIVYELDKRLMCWLRDGRTMIGVLKSVDQYGNLQLVETIERIYVTTTYGDIPRGIVVIKGDNLLVIGEVDDKLEQALPLKKAAIDDVLQEQALILEQKQKERKAVRAAMRSKGITEFAELAPDFD